MIIVHGELSERFKEPVLKTGDSERNLGFESLTLRHKKTPPSGGFFIGGEFKRFEEAGLTVGGVKKCPVDTFLGRGRIHAHPDASIRMRTDVHNLLQYF